MEHSVSVIIPAWNEEQYLLKTSKFLKRLKLPFKYSEIIFVAGGTDNTFKICNDLKLDNFNNVIIIKQESGDYKSGALIKGLKQARGDYIILIDADVFVSSNMAIEISKLMPKYDCLCCNFIPMINRGFWYIYYISVKQIWAHNPTNLNSLIGGATISLNRGVIEEIGIENFFSDKTTAGVDYYMSLTLKKHNKTIGFVKNTCVIVPRPNNLKDFIEDWKRWLNAFIALHKRDQRFLYTNLILALLEILFPPLILSSNFKNLMKISKSEYPKIKIHCIFFFIEYIKRILSINAILRIFSKSQKSIGHFKGVDRYF